MAFNIKPLEASEHPEVSPIPREIRTQQDPLDFDLHKHEHKNSKKKKFLWKGNSVHGELKAEVLYYLKKINLL